MIDCLFLLIWATVTNGLHFNGGIIRWTPIDPYDNSSSVTITIIQSYSWAYPPIECADNVPISTSTRSRANNNLTCVTDCTTDGGYSSKPVDILTDCISASSSVGMMKSERSVNVTLAAGAHFYVAHVGSAWRTLNSPPNRGLQWSIVSFIDVRMRPDGFINTPPTASVVSLQYAIVNITTQIRIFTSDANAGDVVRCRWSVYTPGTGRRRRSMEKGHLTHKNTAKSYKKSIEDEESTRSRKKRVIDNCSKARCYAKCSEDCSCKCVGCIGTTCHGLRCEAFNGCPVSTTTLETPGTIPSTASYPIRQAIDECGGICYPGSMPNDTNLSNCVLSFRGLVPDTWYAVAIQTSIIPMSSVPVQFLIHVLPQPACDQSPLFIPIEDCLEVTVGVSISFNFSVMNLCDPGISAIADILVSSENIGVQAGNLTNSFTNTSLVFVTFIWTPKANQVGAQQFCVIALTDEYVQSSQYCVTFVVITSSQRCAATTTTMTTSTSTSSETTATIATTSATVLTEAEISTNVPGKGPSWGLIAGILSVALPLTLCCFCCLYRLLWSPAAKRRREGVVESENRWKFRHLTSNRDSIERTSTPRTTENSLIEVPKNSYQVYNVLAKEGSVNTNSSTIDSGGSILVAMYNNSNGRRATSIGAQNAEGPFEMGNAWMKPRASEDVSSNMPGTRCAVMTDYSVSPAHKFKATKESFDSDNESVAEEKRRGIPTPPLDMGPSSMSQSHLEVAYQMDQARRLGDSSFSFKEGSSLSPA